MYTFQPGEEALYVDGDIQHQVIIEEYLNDGSGNIRMRFPNLGFTLNMPGDNLIKTGPKPKSGLSKFLEDNCV